MLIYLLIFVLMIIITGASDGLGQELAKLYYEAGKTVVNISRRLCNYANYNMLYNLCEGCTIAQAVHDIGAIEEPIEAIVNCAGVLSIQPLGEITEDEIKRLMSTNVKSQILLISYLMEHIVQDETDIVNVASTLGFKGYVNQAVYGASKWAVRGFTANLQEEFKGKPNRIISFCPGGFKSRFFEKATGIDNTNEGNWMDAHYLAVVIKHILDLPKNMEVSEIIINRK